ncbi:hypothetical protein EVAR_96608_1 [Eumeta japonica]|uniref:Uncharacterized protein n=1 Tax=Eumeta variegata TaxID=151549 RepID=A0A4C1WSW4_EUMVA|nr:hypothetical protein EVAR_96608_1 [Eumeta japonica]
MPNIIKLIKLDEFVPENLLNKLNKKLCSFSFHFHFQKGADAHKFEEKGAQRRGTPIGTRNLWSWRSRGARAGIRPLPSAARLCASCLLSVYFSRSDIVESGPDTRRPARSPFRNTDVALNVCFARAPVFLPSIFHEIIKIAPKEGTVNMPRG